MSTLIATSALAAGEIKLPHPDKVGKKTLMHAINMRKSSKIYINKEIDAVTLGTILWAAYGLNRSTGERTIPTAMNQKDLSVYVTKKDGTYKYDADYHQLIPVSKEDLRPLFNTQEYMADVPVVLIYTGSKEDYASMHAGSAYQNVGLFAAANEMGSVVRGYFDKEAVHKALNLPVEERVIISQAVGYTQ
ncbi:MAG: nitroreductase family protein [Alphaproteobacteria bacterium]|nr:nitroreductase family protein [Alphaproteobacteria bacterium]